MRSEPLALRTVPKSQSVPRIRHAVGISDLAARRNWIADRSGAQFSRPCQATILHGPQLFRGNLVDRDLEGLNTANLFQAPDELSDLKTEIGSMTQFDEPPVLVSP